MPEMNVYQSRLCVIIISVCMVDYLIGHFYIALSPLLNITTVLT